MVNTGKTKDINKLVIKGTKNNKSHKAKDVKTDEPTPALDKSRAMKFYM